MSNYKAKTVPDIIILVAPCFEENAVVYCLSELRKHGLTVALVSVTPGCVQSRQNVKFCPDASLSQADELLPAPPTCKRQLLLLAGGAECAATLLADPRTHNLVQHILQADGYIAAMSQTYGLMRETGLLRPEWAGRFLREKEGEGETAVFVQQVLEQIPV